MVLLLKLARVYFIVLMTDRFFSMACLLCSGFDKNRGARKVWYIVFFNWFFELN